MTIPSPIAWTPDHAVRILDQTLLPGEERYLDLDTVDAVAEAIRTLRVRGAPLIGIAAAMWVTLPLRRGAASLDAVCAASATSVRRAYRRQPSLGARPHGRRRRRGGGGGRLGRGARAEANAIWEEDRAMRPDRHGGGDPDRRRRGGATHCNAGARNRGHGTALAPRTRCTSPGAGVRRADETRPLLQGSRLTAWELSRAGVPVTVIADGMAASRLRKGDITCVIVGADRIAANGDVANKIGTYALALAARAHGVPFYVAAPSSTVDLATRDGRAIPIEERSGDEISTWGTPHARRRASRCGTPRSTSPPPTW
jgi:methylthioribose-1-phosphate isomerase